MLAGFKIKVSDYGNKIMINEEECSFTVTLSKNIGERMGMQIRQWHANGIFPDEFDHHSCRPYVYDRRMKQYVSQHMILCPYFAKAVYDAEMELNQESGIKLTCASEREIQTILTYDHHDDCQRPVQKNRRRLRTPSCKTR